MVIVHRSSFIVHWLQPRPAAPRRAARGYTLIELIVVIAIMGIIAGIAVPKVIGSLYSGKQRSEAFQLLTAIRYAQGMAALQRAPYRLHFDL
ncbi:MAG: prepilin-type N-terminal cleavage/methylation domain-containing protein, partial [bacterium]|nr:prepilin-type N-terminal cleavage/methylation domain-containing protein [bacterium]